MRTSVCLLLLSSVLPAAAASARPTARDLGIVMPDLHQHELRERLRSLPGLAFLAGDLGSHHLELVDEAITIDPRTGVATATVSVTLTAGPGGLQMLLLLFEEGLLTEEVSDLNGPVPYDEFASTGYRYVQIMLDEPLPQGTRTTFRVRYAGTLLCPASGGYASCDYGGQRLDFAFSGTLFPIVYDPLDYSTTPYYESRLSLTVPSGI